MLSGRDAVFAALGEPGFDPRRVVLLESEPVPPPAAGASGEVRILGESSDHVELAVRCDAPAILLLTDTYSRHWRARTLEPGPQASYRLLPANWTLRAVPLAAGSHRLLLEYAPPSFRIGLWISLAAWIAWIALGLGAQRRARRSPSA